VCPSFLSKAQLARLCDEVGHQRTLLVYCEAFQAEPDEFPNLTIKKIPKTILSRCEWSRDDYSLTSNEGVGNRSTKSRSEYLAPSLSGRRRKNVRKSQGAAT
jgi:hypothetical protein